MKSNKLINQLGYTNEVIIDPDKIKFYFHNLWNKEYGLGLYFSAFHELNQHLYIPVAVDKKLYLAPHALYDGFSILNKINELENLGIQLPQLPPRSKPKALKWVSCFVSALLSPKGSTIHFNMARQELSDPQQAQSICIKIPGEKIKNSSTSYVLNKVSSVCTKSFTNNNSTRWMVPVNIRGEVNPSKKSDICSSYIGIISNTADSPLDTKNKLKNKLINNEHWFFWLVSKLGLILGRTFIMYVTKLSLKNQKLSWLGLFSSLGDIGGNQTKDLIVMAPVRYHRPLGVIYYKFNDYYYLVLNIHDSIKANIDMDKLKDEIYQSVII